MTKPKLKYLFEVNFTDGTTYSQTPEDQHPTKPEKSEYTLIREMVEGGKTIRSFALVSSDNFVLVDLLTGMFYVNGFPILLESEKVPTLPDKFELIFYRQWTVDRNISYKVNDEGNPEVTDTKDNEPFGEYFIGWQCTIAGKNYKQKLGVA